jgi:NAD(P)H-hydrate epimerase
MENAGRGLCAVLLREAALRRWPAPLRVAVVCGKGNNGGDGFVLARHLANRGAEPRLLLAFDPAAAARTGDAGTNLAICERMAIPMAFVADGPALAAALRAEPAHVLVDALFGTGLEGEVRGRYRGIIEAMNEAGLPIVAVDLPSGFDADNGAILGAAVRATATATFAAAKQGFAAAGARALTGPVTVVDIGSPWQASSRAAGPGGAA